MKLILIGICSFIQLVVVEDLVHRAAQAVVAAVHDPVVVVHQAAHVAHAVEASPVEDVPNQSRQRVAVARSQSEYYFKYNFTASIYLCIVFH